LPELFQCRSLGQGYAGLISALFFGLRNLAGEVATREQLLAMKLAVSRLRYHPFSSLEDVVEYVIRMEDSGLVVESGELSRLSESHAD
jgi:hypothetical protein